MGFHGEVKVNRWNTPEDGGLIKGVGANGGRPLAAPTLYPAALSSSSSGAQREEDKDVLASSPRPMQEYQEHLGQENSGHCRRSP